MISKNKKTLTFFLSVFLGIFFPLYFVSANWVTNLALNIALWPVMQIFKIISDFSIFCAGMAGSVLAWVLSPNFISYSYTNPGNNPAIRAGLDVTQGFVNMILILILVYIGIATILRLAGYETKKLLVTFIVVALLVNFAPVICGIVVDASNIVMNFFIGDLGTERFSDQMKNTVSNSVGNFDIKAPYEQTKGIIFKIAILSSFLFVLSLILLLFALVFMFRYLAIWVLVILSPIAFACYILPNTREYFQKWWKQLLSWSFVGTTCGFFLYLGLFLASNIQTGLSSGEGVSVPTSENIAMFDNVLPYFVAVAFLGLGLLLGLKTSAMGGNAVIGFANRNKTKIAAAPFKAGAKAGGFLRNKALETERGEKVRKWAERTATAGRWGEGEEGTKGFLKRSVSTISPFRWGRRAVGGALGAGLVEAEQSDIRQKEEKIKETDTHKTRAKRYRAAITDNQRIAEISKAIDHDELNDMMDEKKLGEDALSEKEVKRILRRAQKLGSDSTAYKKISKAIPHLMDEKDITEEDKLKGIKTKADKIKQVVGKMKPKDYKNISEKALDNITVVDTMLSQAMGTHISQLIDAHGKEAVGALQKRIDAGASVSASIKKWNASSPGQAVAGMNIPERPETQEDYSV